MAAMIKIKRGSGLPSSLGEGELALDMAGKRLFIGGEAGTDVLTVAGVSGSSPWGHFQEPVISVQTDNTLDPGASPADGDRYLIANAASLHANFGTITSPVAVGNNDLVEYDANDNEFKVVYDASVGGEGLIVYVESENKHYSFDGASYTPVASSTLQQAYDNGNTIDTSSAAPVAISKSTGTQDLLDVTMSGGGNASTILTDITKTSGTADKLLNVANSGGTTASVAVITTSGNVTNSVAEVSASGTATTGNGVFSVNNANASNAKPAIQITQAASAADIRFKATNTANPGTTGTGDTWFVNNGSDVSLRFDAGSANYAAPMVDDTTIAAGDLIHRGASGWEATTTLSGSYTLSGTNTLTGSISTSGSGQINIAASTTLDVNGTLDASGATSVLVPTPTLDGQAANKAYVDSVAAGLDPKASVRVASTVDVLTLGTGGAYSAGQFTWSAGPTTIDSVTIANTNRILVKNQATATQNGIYVRTSSTVWDRADDQDGSPANEVSGGNFTFVEEGTNYADTGWVVTGNGTLTLDTDNIDWVQFSSAGTVTASNGLTKVGNDVQLNLSDLSSATIVGADSLAFVDASDSNNEKTTTVTNLLADLDIPNGITANGMVTRTAADTYASRSVAGTASRISVTNGDGVAGNPTVDIDASYVGQTSITTLGTVTTGTWNATAVTVPYGGTGATSLTANGILIGNGTSAVSATTLTNGQILIGSTGSAPVAATLTGGVGVDVTNNAGSIELTVDLTEATVGTSASTDYLVFTDNASSFEKSTIANFITDNNISTSALTKLDDTDSANFLVLASTSTLTTDKTLTFDVDDGNRTLRLGANLTLTGGALTFTVDEATTINTSGSAVGALIYKDAANSWVDLALGSRGSILVANGASPSLQWEAPSAGETATQYVMGINASGDAVFCDVIDAGLY